MNFLDIVEFFDRGLIGILFGVINGYIISNYFNSRKKLAFQSRSFKYRFTDKYPVNYSDTYKGVFTSKLTRTIYFIWNSGNQIVDGVEISSVDPLRIYAKSGSQIIGTNILNKSREVNQVTFESNNDYIDLSFNYLYPKDGFVLEIIHTNKSRPYIKGEIKGLPKGVENYGDFLFLSGQRGAVISSVFVLIITSLIYLFYVITGIVPPKFETKEGMYVMLAIGYFTSITGFVFSNKCFPTKLKIDIDEMTRNPYRNDN